MNYDLEIAFDFKNSKEYISIYDCEEFTKTEGLPENIRDKKFFIFKQLEPNCQEIGTYLLDFMNTNFTDIEDFKLLLLKYLFVPLLFFYNPNILNDCLYIKSLEDNGIYINANYLILSEEEIKLYFELFYKLYWFKFSTTQQEFKVIFENKYYKNILEVTNVSENCYDLFEELSKKENNFSAIKDIAPEYDTIGISYNTGNYYDNNISAYFYSKNPMDIAYVSVRELLNNRKSFRLVRCGICDYFFIPKTSHKTLYCDDIFEDGKTCKEYAKLVSSTRTYESDPLCKKYRRRYKNLQKQADTSNNPRSSLLYEEYKLKGPDMYTKYQLGKITAEKFENWIDGMKIRK